MVYNQSGEGIEGEERRWMDDEVVHEFLVESEENLTRLDKEIVTLEQQPGHAGLLASIFRTFHTIKGTCGFLGFSLLEKLTHQAENLLSNLRSGVMPATPPIISLILESVDAIRKILAEIGETGQEPILDYTDLIRRLGEAVNSVGVAVIVDETGADTHAIKTAADASLTAIPQFTSEHEPAIADKGGFTDNTIRVDVNLLDKLMNLVGELVLARNQILQYKDRQEDAVLNATSQRLNLITSELQESVMKTRMQPIGVVWNKLPRLVRDLSKSLDKHVELKMEGAGTELDRTIIEAIKDPLTHLIRNCCDHGIEHPDVRADKGKPVAGTITLRAFHEGGHVIIEIHDDGKGIDSVRLKQKAIEKGILRPEQADRMGDREALSLIFHPGFSTAETVTRISGRGVGMDVVKSNIERIGGAIDVSTAVDVGATVRLKIPLTLAIIPGLVIETGGQRFVIPQVSLVELIRLEGDGADRKIEWLHDAPVYRRRGALLPVAFLNRVLGLPEMAASEAANIVVVQAEQRHFGLVVDHILDTQEIVVKPLGKQLKNLATYAGATIMGDGRVALILDVMGVGKTSGVFTSRATEQQPAEAGGLQKRGLERILLFRSGTYARIALPLSVVARLEEFAQSSIERAAGRAVVQYRDRILPLVSLNAVLSGGDDGGALACDPLQVVVIKEDDRMLGMVVDEILDIIEDRLEARQGSSHKGLLGAAVVQNQITDVLDLEPVIEWVGDAWKSMTAAQGTASIVLLAEGSQFRRGLVRSALEMSGWQVVEAGDESAALRCLEEQTIHVVVASTDLPPSGCKALLRRLKEDPKLKHVKVLGSGTGSAGRQLAGFDDFQSRGDAGGILASVRRLAEAVESTESLDVA